MAESNDDEKRLKQLQAAEEELQVYSAPNVFPEFDYRMLTNTFVDDISAVESEASSRSARLENANPKRPRIRGSRTRS